jgi:hypothetical protein
MGCDWQVAFRFHVRYRCLLGLWRALFFLYPCDRRLLVSFSSWKLLSSAPDGVAVFCTICNDGWFLSLVALASWRGFSLLLGSTLLRPRKEVYLLVENLHISVYYVPAVVRPIGDDDG